MSDEEQAEHKLSHSKYINHSRCPDRYKKFLTLKEKHLVDIFVTKHIISLC